MDTVGTTERAGERSCGGACAAHNRGDCSSANPGRSILVRCALRSIGSVTRHLGGFKLRSATARRNNNDEGFAHDLNISRREKRAGTPGESQVEPRRFRVGQ